MGYGTKKQQGLLLTAVVLFWFAQYVYIPFQTTYLTAREVSEAYIGGILGAYGIAQLVMRIPVGVMADSIGRHRGFILAGTIAAGLASVIRINMPGGNGFFIANLFSGFASAMWISFMVLYTGFFPAAEQQKATSRIILFNNLGILLGFISSTYLYKIFGMSFLCLLSTFSAFAGTIISLPLCDSKEKQHPAGSPLKTLKVCLNKRLILFACLALIQQGIQMSTTMSFTIQILKDLGASSILIGLSSIIYMLSAVGFSGLASFSWFSKKGPAFLIPVVFTLLAVYCFLIPTIRPVPILLFLQILPGLATGILFSYLTSEAMKGIAPGVKSTAMGFYQAVYAIGMTLVPVFTGNFVHMFSMKSAYFILAGFAFMGSMIAVCYYHMTALTSE
ncbi:MFS transporter [Anaerocolumna sedimenticola]|uniref:MFS transporter n=1 Tax=Anaerocolumna sedimenticola TaxID=2696063 RepID=A0A6P1TP46_9FIRM|nr:MFS transporter [Anaerocolumna sedimenticola]QHQ61651.1 MFS transporter [Anaerocolumna sedimenticola]